MAAQGTHDLHFTVEGESAPSMMGAMEEQQQQLPPGDGGKAGGFARHLGRSSHPIICVFHVLFKVLSLFLYIFGGWFARGSKGVVTGANFITVTVFCILLLAVDFWVTKNITGRLLVGLRWWNQVDGDTTRWIFESKNQEDSLNAFDRSFFWTVLYFTPIIWGGLFIIALLKFELGWLMTVVMALSLSMANVYGYYKCSSDQKAKFQQMMVQGAERGMGAALRSNLFGMLVGAATGANSSGSSSSSASSQNGSMATTTYA